MMVKDLDMTAAIIAATGQQPALNDHREAGLTGFTFPDTAEITKAAALYYTGDLFISARKLLKARGDLYKQLRRKK